jgi:hypothetical protein
MSRLPLFLIRFHDNPDLPAGTLTFELTADITKKQPGCLCCTNRSALAEQLNCLYLDWVHDRQSFAALALRLPEHAEEAKITAHLASDVLITARFTF